jgi:hypothetical protein
MRPASPARQIRNGERQSRSKGESVVMATQIRGPSDSSRRAGSGARRVYHEVGQKSLSRHQSASPNTCRGGPACTPMVKSRPEIEYRTATRRIMLRKSEDRPTPSWRFSKRGDHRFHQSYRVQQRAEPPAQPAHEVTSSHGSTGRCSGGGMAGSGGYRRIDGRVGNGGGEFVGRAGAR